MSSNATVSVGGSPPKTLPVPVWGPYFSLKLFIFRRPELLIVTGAVSAIWLAAARLTTSALAPPITVADD